MTLRALYCTYRQQMNCTSNILTFQYFLKLLQEINKERFESEVNMKPFNPISRRGGVLCPLRKNCNQTLKSNDAELKKITFPNSL